MVLSIGILLFPSPLESSVFISNAEGLMRDMARMSFLRPQQGTFNEHLSDPTCQVSYQQKGVVWG